MLVAKSVLPKSHYYSSLLLAFHFVKAVTRRDLREYEFEICDCIIY